MHNNLVNLYFLSLFNCEVKRERKQRQKTDCWQSAKLVCVSKQRRHATTKSKTETRDKKQPQCPNGHKTEWMLQAFACTHTLTIAAKLHVRD